MSARGRVTLLALAARVGVTLLALATLAGCASSPPPSTPGRPFVFERDTLAYSNKLYWSYDFSDPEAVVVTPEPGTPPEGGHRCATMARAVRQFFRAARFDPSTPKLSDAEYRALVRQVLGTNPRARGPAAERTTIPGYAGLRSFSSEHEAAIDLELGGARGTYLQRGNWRMIFPFAPRQNRAAVERWLGHLARSDPPIVRVVNFPDIDINHTLVLYEAEASPVEVRFRAFDPNDASAPITLVFERASATFVYPATSYHRGGRVQVFEVYDGFFF